jgi:hypothetical protein
LGDLYVQRTLTINKGTESERKISEEEIDDSAMAMVILGDPGMGKTRLTKELERKLSGVRVAAGTFYRNADLSKYEISPKPLIIDGLDEITTSSGAAAIDEILKKLSILKYPKFVLSCRAADWQGSVDRYKIASDYSTEPITLHLEPFSRDDAIVFLNQSNPTIDAEKVLDTLAERGLDEFYGNPLTLELIGELLKGGGDLPATRSELLFDACQILVREANFAHKSSVAAKTGQEDLLRSAGAIFAHLLLSNTLGVADRERGDVPAGYVGAMDAEQLVEARLVRATLTTRLFRSEAEGLFIPFHRVIAEYLGASWIAHRVSSGLSKRRVFATMTHLGGVPTALRGIHAWMGHFNLALASQCIANDPYGLLKYGAIEKLPTDLARLLLRSLAALADEDPYFRSEDWGRSAVTGLVRPELLKEIIELIRHPDRHQQLSTFLLQALQNSTLAGDVSEDMVSIVLDEDCSYEERLSAIQALQASQAEVDWRDLAARLGRTHRFDSRILVLDIVAGLGGAGFSGEEIGSAIYRYFGFQSGSESEEDEEELSHVTSVDLSLTQKLNSEVCAEILDSWVRRKRKRSKTNRWRQQRRLCQIVEQLIERCVRAGERTPDRVWSWLKLNHERSWSRNSSKSEFDSLFDGDVDLRRSIQKCSFHDEEMDDRPWMSIAVTLPRLNRSLALKPADVSFFLGEITDRSALSNSDIELWISLVRSLGRQVLDDSDCNATAMTGVLRHRSLRKHWKNLTNFDQKSKWEKEDERRRARERKRRDAKFEAQRASIMSQKEHLQSGKNLGLLEHIAKGYLDLYHELDSDVQPVDRLRGWLGDELTELALQGFQALLLRDDLPSVADLGECHASGQHYNTELPAQCGVIEAVRTERELGALPQRALESVLASWWDVPPTREVAAEDIQDRVEAVILASKISKERFLRGIIEPQLKRGSQSVRGLYRMNHDDIFAEVAGPLALDWLRQFPNLPPLAQSEILDAAIQHGDTSELAEVILARCNTIRADDTEAKRVWLSALFLIDLENNREAISAFCREDPDRIWCIRSLVRPERSGQSRSVSVAHLEFIVEHFGSVWPAVGHPSSGWRGDKNPWDATSLISSCIDALGSSLEPEAEDAITRLLGKVSDDVYRRRLKHVRNLSRRAKRDREFKVQTFDELRRTLSAGLPSSAADMKAVLMDAIEITQDYLKNGDTMGWHAFWDGERPHIENRCRDRLTDLLRTQVPSDIHLLPETAMPNSGRADIGAMFNGTGIPIEVKGQWNENVWGAADDQLVDRYSKDWRAEGHGIYVVLWFGDVPGHNLPLHPKGTPKPTSALELRDLLKAQLRVDLRQKIDVVVIDVSRPIAKESRKKKRKPRIKKPRED